MKLRLFILLISAVILPLKAEVVLTGLSPEMSEAVLARLGISGQPCDLNPWVARYQSRNIKAETELVLESFGYYQPTIQTSLSYGESCWRVDLHVDQGKPVLIKQSNISVVPSPFDFQRVERKGVSSGQRFDHGAYEAFKSELESVALEKGYFDASFLTRDVKVSLESSSADLEVVLDTGPRYVIGDINYLESGLKDEIMNRYLPFKRGDAYDATSLGKLYQALISSDYFSDVSVDADVDGRAKGQVPVNVYLKPADPDETRLGLGYSTDLGARASVNYTNKRLNSSGHRAEAMFAIAESESEIGGLYRVPYGDNDLGWTSFYGGAKKTATDTSQVTTLKIGVRQLVPLPGNWVMTRYFEVVSDDFNLAGEDQVALNYVPGVSFDWNPYKTVSRPESGYRLTFGASGTSRKIGSDSDFVNLLASSKVIFPLWKKGRLILQGQAGLVLSDDFERLPPGNRYFTGGDSKVRGFDYQSLGPVNDEGEVIGGNRLLEASVELDHLISERWALAIFVDGGSASLDKFDSELQTAFGVGVRWYSPIGPLRFDLATPTDSGGVRLHINLGPDL